MGSLNGAPEGNISGVSSRRMESQGLHSEAGHSVGLYQDCVRICSKEGFILPLLSHGIVSYR